jgi:hypothetical protein
MAQAFHYPWGKVILGHPAYDGIETKLGCAWDWRPGETGADGKIGCTWSQWGCEYIPPLGCIAPMCDVRPREMKYDATEAWDAKHDIGGQDAWWTLNPQVPCLREPVSAVVALLRWHAVCTEVR